MKINPRLERIAALIDERGFLTVGELSRLCNVSEMTVRRHLEQLDALGRIKRTYGGAVPLRSLSESVHEAESQSEADAFPVEHVDVLIATSVDPYYDSFLVDRAIKKNIPIIAESIEMADQRTLVAVDNYRAGFDLGRWAGSYLRDKGLGKASVLDLTFHKPNTQARSRGFMEGLAESMPDHELVLSINAQSRRATSCQMARDALSVYPQINLIFAINDSTALGAIDACRELDLDPDRMTVITFGLEGDTLKNELAERGAYCKAGLAMFPEIVSLTCIEAAIAAFNQQHLPERYLTPHVILSRETLTDYYKRSASGWELRWDVARQHLKIPIAIEGEKSRSRTRLPAKIGLIVPFSEHEWYKNLTAMLRAYAGQYSIAFQIIDAEQNARDEVESRRRSIAARAATLVQPGDVLLVDGGALAVYLAQELKTVKDITIITNSVTVFDVLNRTAGITLISTGGAIRYSSQMLVGPTAETMLKELRADKLFLMPSGITLDFGLSHQTISEVTMKQAMISSAREVIVLADHTCFGAEAGIQIAPLSVVQRLITDDALPPSLRLELSKAGIQVVLA